MKKIFTLLNAIFISTLSFGWGNDVMVGPQPTAKATVVSTLDGSLYAAIPAGNTGVGGIFMMKSTDMGNSWVNIGNPAMGQWVNKSKLVVTGVDSVYCIYTIGTALNTYSCASGIVTPFTAYGADDFDVSPSVVDNSLYLFFTVANTNDIRRFSSTDGGYTWGGSSALVTSDGVSPRISMNGSRLILDFYGAVLTDTSTSKIRAATYDETGPGALVAGTFQDIVPAGIIHHRQFQPVISSLGVVWFFYTEGDNTEVINVMVSNDSGDSYGIPFTLAGNAQADASCFDACYTNAAAENGVYLTYLLDSAGIMTMNRTSSTSIQSNTFTFPEAFNDFTPECFDPTGYPSICSMNNSTVGETGIVWTENDTFSSLFYDASYFVTGINDVSKETWKVFPNPASEYFTINIQGLQKIELVDLAGKILYAQELSADEALIDISSYSNGIYLLNAVTKSNSISAKVIKQ
jgi:hypothetical protein